MATVKEHYEQVLSDVYSWMAGGFNSGIERNIDFFKKHKITPLRSAKAIDLGAGCGFQSIPLAKAGFSVTAIDIDGKLLKELTDNSGSLEINIIRASHWVQQDAPEEFSDALIGFFAEARVRE